MQSQLESQTLSPRALVFPFPRRQEFLAQEMAKPSPRLSACLELHRATKRGAVGERFAWLALAISSLALLVLSFLG